MILAPRLRQKILKGALVRGRSLLLLLLFQSTSRHLCPQFFDKRWMGRQKKRPQLLKNSSMIRGGLLCNCKKLFKRTVSLSIYSVGVLVSTHLIILQRSHISHPPYLIRRIFLLNRKNNLRRHRNTLFHTLLYLIFITL